jgi:hypothetical protein
MAAETKSDCRQSPEPTVHADANPPQVPMPKAHRTLVSQAFDFIVLGVGGSPYEVNQTMYDQSNGSDDH